MPINEQARALATSRRTALIEASARRYRDELAKLKLDMSNRGMLTSGNFAAAVAKRYLDHIERFAQAVRDSWLEALDIGGIAIDPEYESEIARDVKAVFATARNKHEETLRNVLGPVGEFMPPDVLDSINGLEHRALRDLNAKRLEAELRKAAPSAATVDVVRKPEQRSFAFVADAQLRGIVERDYQEMQRAFIAQCWKSSLILAGGILEAVLGSLIEANKSAALASPKAKGKPTDIGRWDLSDLIDVAVELRLVSDGLSKLSHPVREYRNLVHPGNEIRNRLTFGPEEARIGVEIVHILHRSLSGAP